MSILRWDRWSVKLGLAVLVVLAVLAWQVGQVGAQQGGRGGGGAAAQGGAGRGAGGGGAQAEGRGRGPAPISGDPILVGVIDLHAHQGPDNRPRSIDFLDAARYSKLRGMRG